MEKAIQVKYLLRTIKEECPIVIRNVSSNHKCALNWCDRCAYCELGYDELVPLLREPSNSLSSEEMIQLREKLFYLSSIIKDYNDQTLEKFRNYLEFNINEVKIAFESYKNEYEKMKEELLNMAKEKLAILIKETLNKIKRKANMIENAENINDEFIRSYVALHNFTIKLFSKINFCNPKYNLQTHYSLYYSEEVYYSFKIINSYNVDSDKYIYDIFDCNNEFYAIVKNELTFSIEKLPFNSSFRLWEKSSVKRIGSINENKVLFFNENEISFRSRNEKNIEIWSKLNQNSMNFKLENDIVELLDESLIAVLNDRIIKIYNAGSDKLELILKIKTKHRRSIKCLKNLSKNRFASASIDSLKIWSYDGNRLEDIDLNSRFVPILDFLSDKLLAVSFNEINCIQIWDFENGDLVKEFNNSLLIGVTPIGFFIRPKYNSKQKRAKKISQLKKTDLISEFYNSEKYECTDSLQIDDPNDKSTRNEYESFTEHIDKENKTINNANTNNDDDKLKFSFDEIREIDLNENNIQLYDFDTLQLIKEEDNYRNLSNYKIQKLFKIHDDLFSMVIVNESSGNKEIKIIQCQKRKPINMFENHICMKNDSISCVICDITKVMEEMNTKTNEDKIIEIKNYFKGNQYLEILTNQAYENFKLDFEEIFNDFQSEREKKLQRNYSVAIKHIHQFLSMKFQNVKIHLNDNALDTLTVDDLDKIAIDYQRKLITNLEVNLLTDTFKIIPELQHSPISFLVKLFIFDIIGNYYKRYKFIREITEIFPNDSFRFFGKNLSIYKNFDENVILRVTDDVKININRDKNDKFFSINDRYFIQATSLFKIIIWDIETKQSSEIKTYGELILVNHFDDNKLFFSEYRTQSKGYLSIWSFSDGFLKLVKRVNAPVSKYFPTSIILPGNEIACNVDFYLKIWNMNLEEIQSVKLKFEIKNVIYFENYLLFIEIKNKIVLLNYKTGEIIKEIEKGNDYYMERLTPDKCFLILDSGKTYKFLDLKNFKTFLISMKPQWMGQKIHFTDQYISFYQNNKLQIFST